MAWAGSIEKNIDHILSIKLKKLRKLSPEQVKELGGIALFQKLGVDKKFVTFRTLVNEFMSEWTGKDDSYYRRSAFWLSVFNDTPIKSIKASHIIAGGSLSPQLSAVMLTSFDKTMDKEIRKGHVWYIRYMDDFVVLAKTRHQFRKAIKQVHAVMCQLKLTLNKKQKCFIGKTETGFDFFRLSGVSASVITLLS